MVKKTDEKTLFSFNLDLNVICLTRETHYVRKRELFLCLSLYEALKLSVRVGGVEVDVVGKFNILPPTFPPSSSHKLE